MQLHVSAGFRFAVTHEAWRSICLWICTILARRVKKILPHLIFKWQEGALADIFADVRTVDLRDPRAVVFFIVGRESRPKRESQLVRSATARVRRDARPRFNDF